MITLRPYQSEAIDAVEHAWQRGIAKPVITLPTGTGKTVVFSEIIDRTPGRVLVLAHRDELITQAQNKIAQIVTDRDIGRVQADEDNKDAAIVVASVQSLHTKRLQRWNPGTFDLIVIDECHHAAAPTYKNIINYLAPPKLLGVTATPFRGDNVTLKTVFNDIVYHLTLRDAIRQKWLTDIRAFRVESQTNLDPIKTQGGDFQAGDLEDALNNPERNALILQAIQQYGKGKRTVIFTAGVAHAHALAAMANAQQIPSAAITGDTPREERHALLEQFHRGTLTTLFNVAVLTEGWDEPAIECLILARPTKSLPLFTQIVGRGVRPSPATGKTELTLVDITDTTKRHKIVSIHHLIGLNKPVESGESVAKADKWESEGLDVATSFWNHVLPALNVTEIPDLLSDWVMTGPLPAYNWQDLADDLDNFRAHPEEWENAPTFSETIPTTEGQRYTLLNYGWDPQYIPASAKEATWAIDQHMQQFHQWAAQRVGAWASLTAEPPDSLRDNMFNQPWHFKNATTAQVNLLTRLKIPLPPYPLTAGEASWVIDHVKKQKEKEKENKRAQAIS